MNNKVNQNSVNFNARLYNTKQQLVKCTNFFETFSGKDTMSLKGSPNTDIFVNSIKSELLSKLGGFKITADIKISNPLLGLQSFSEVIDSHYASPCEDEIDELHFLDKLVGIRTNDCKNLENRALFMRIMEQFKINSKKADCISTPSKILEKMLQETPRDKHGFTADRIREFQEIARNMDESLEKDHKIAGHEWMV